MLLPPREAAGPRATANGELRGQQGDSGEEFFASHNRDADALANPRVRARSGPPLSFSHLAIFRQQCLESVRIRGGRQLNPDEWNGCGKGGHDLDDGRITDLETAELCPDRLFPQARLTTLHARRHSEIRAHDEHPTIV